MRPSHAAPFLVRYSEASLRVGFVAQMALEVVESYSAESALWFAPVCIRSRVCSNSAAALR